MKQRQEIHPYQQVPTPEDILSLRPSAKAIFWDMDGTIFRTEDLHHIAVGHFMQQFGHAPLSHELIVNHFWGISDPQVYDKIVELWPNEKWPSFDYFLEYKNKEALELIEKNRDQVFPVHLKKFLLDFGKKNLTMGLVTSCERELTHHLLEFFEIKNQFSFIITRQDVTEVKPSPIPYLQALGKTPFKVEEVIVFEDSPAGIASAQKAGVKTIIKAEWFSPLSEHK